MKEDLRREIVLGEGVTAQLDGRVLVVKGPKGEVSRDFRHPKISISIESGKIVLEAKKGTKREKTGIGSFESHIKNMVKGVVDPFVYTLKICSGHFPMNVAVSGQELTIKNFLGEAVPRKVQLQEGTIVKINGTDITITSPDKEKAGQTAARIESLCRITNRDRRIFQDGIYIVDKAGRAM
ncbi:TPA: 50S ribosomal protein L6 [Candidatus Woesearchaeota archaeon]|nr:50S ribosomal protein L6 [archaeon]HIJ10983.1 50S ribosomal protein L6 [Candidatus Woesearchaeota archaeon]